jgi:glutaredoxin
VSGAGNRPGPVGEQANKSGRLPEVVLYGRPGCHLCDDAREILERVRAELPFALSERDIERDDALLKAYLERIPVVTVDGEEVFEFFVDADELRRRLAG